MDAVKKDGTPIKLLEELLEELKTPVDVTEQERLEIYEYELQIPIEHTEGGNSRPDRPA